MTTDEAMALSHEALATTLTPAQEQILSLVAQGLQYKAVAKRLGLTPVVVQERMKTIMATMGAKGKTDAAVRAVRLGLI